MPVLTAVLALLSFVVPLATDMYLPALPRMAQELHTDASGIQLTLTAFLIGMALGQLVFGPLSDRLGRRGPILIGAAACTVATALCALSPSLGWLVAFRFVQGFSGAAGVVIGRAVITDVAQGARAARLFGILMTLGGIAPILAPLVGGVIVEASSWRMVFWVLTAASVVMFLGALFGIKESLPKEKRRAGGLPTTLRAARSVLSDRTFLGYTLAFTFAFGMLFAWIAGSPFVLQNALGLSVGISSAVFSACALVATISSAVGARLVGRYGAAALLRVGLVTTLAGNVVLAVGAVAGLLTAVLTVAVLIVVCAGLGLIIANAAALALERVPGASGTGSAVMGTLQSALGAAVAPLVGLGGEHTAVPTFVAMALLTALALFSLALTRGGRPVAGEAAGQETPVAVRAEAAELTCKTP